MDISDKTRMSVAIDQLFTKIWKSPIDMEKMAGSKLLINTLNTHSFVTALDDPDFFNALLNSDVLIPDGVGIIFGLKLLYREKVRKIAGYDLFELEMQKLDNSRGRCFFFGSSLNVLNLIVNRAKTDYPNITVDYNSPPYRTEFTGKENDLMIEHINSFSPDILFVGMTAPKQEKWAYSNFDRLKVGHVCCIGAVFDYYAGTRKRAPIWMIDNGFEWVYRLISEPRRMWRRYLVNNFKFIFLIIEKKIKHTFTISKKKN
jgi:N-acetylglucosaminyldiphosphoundecaprenol N-acetyl-beta-D-mannosaminyltransferase